MTKGLLPALGLPNKYNDKLKKPYKENLMPVGASALASTLPGPALHAPSGNRRAGRFYLVVATTRTNTGNR